MCSIPFYIIFDFPIERSRLYFLCYSINQKIFFFQSLFHLFGMGFPRKQRVVQHCLF